MKKSFLLLLALATVGIPFANAQDAAADSSNWTKGGVGRLTFTQVHLSNWAAGGNSSISGVAFMNVFANWKKGKSTWDNTLDLAYGLIREDQSPDPSYIAKSDDRIEFNSKYGQNAFKHWYYTGLVNFRSQFAPGWNDPETQTGLVSEFFAPAYLMTSLGMDYKPSDNFTLFLSPVTGKTTFVMNQTLADAGAFGVDAAEFDPETGEQTAPGKNVRFEYGGYLKMMYKRDLGKTTKFQTKLDLFSNFLENPGNIDVNWEVLVAAKLGKYFEASIITNLIYDHDIKFALEPETLPNGDPNPNSPISGPRTQFKEVFGLGFSYKF